MKLTVLSCLCIGLAACSPPSQKPSAAPTVQSPAQRAKLWGSWRVVSISGVELVAKSRSNGLASTPPRLSFTQSGFSGNVGCNNFGGQGHFRAGRYHTSMIGSEMAACGDIMNQEIAVGSIMGNYGPRMTFSGDNEVIVTNKDVTMVLAREAPIDSKSPQILNGPKPISLAGTVWGIIDIDRTLADTGSRPTQTQFLTLEADYWKAILACGASTGGWRQQGDHIEILANIATTPKACTPNQAARDAKFIAFMKGSPSFNAFASNSSDEQNYDVAESIMAASDDHVVTLGRGAQFTDDAPILAGHWSIATIDGAKPVPGKTPKLSFGANYYNGTTGCNTITGIFLAHNRFFFTAEGPQTEQGCSGALGAQESRITDLLKFRPSIAKTKSGGVILADQAGHIELVRDTTNTAVLGVIPTRTLYAPPLSVDALMIDGQTIRKHYSAPQTTLGFSALRWEAKLGCNTQSGSWRLGDSGFVGFADPQPYGAPACPGEIAIWNNKINRLIDGQSRVLITKSDFLLARHDHWMSGQVRTK